MSDRDNELVEADWTYPQLLPGWLVMNEMRHQHSDDEEAIRQELAFRYYTHNERALRTKEPDVRAFYSEVEAKARAKVEQLVKLSQDKPPEPVLSQASDQLKTHIGGLAQSALWDKNKVEVLDGLVATQQTMERSVKEEKRVADSTQIAIQAMQRRTFYERDDEDLGDD